MQLAALLDPALAPRGHGRTLAPEAAADAGRLALERAWSKDEILEAYLNLVALPRRAAGRRRGGGLPVRQGPARSRARPSRWCSRRCCGIRTPSADGRSRGARAGSPRAQRHAGDRRRHDRRRRGAPRRAGTARAAAPTWRRTSRAACSRDSSPRSRRRSTPATQRVARDALQRALLSLAGPQRRGRRRAGRRQRERRRARLRRRQRRALARPLRRQRPRAPPGRLDAEALPLRARLRAPPADAGLAARGHAARPRGRRRALPPARLRRAVPRPGEHAHRARLVAERARRAHARPGRRRRLRRAPAPARLRRRRPRAATTTARRWRSAAPTSRSGSWWRRIARSPTAACGRRCASTPDAPTAPASHGASSRPRPRSSSTDILADRESRSATFGLESPLATRFLTAVKTGTSKEMRDNWCLGFSERYTVGVWVGNFSGAPMHDVSGITGAAPVWLEVMTLAAPRDAERRAGAAAGARRRDASTFPTPSSPRRREWFAPGTEPGARTLATGDAAHRRAGRRHDRRPRSRHSRRSASASPLEVAGAAPGLRWRLDDTDLGPAQGFTLWEPAPRDAHGGAGRRGRARARRGDRRGPRSARAADSLIPATPPSPPLGLPILLLSAERVLKTAESTRATNTKTARPRPSAVASPLLSLTTTAPATALRRNHVRSRGDVHVHL